MPAGCAAADVLDSGSPVGVLLRLLNPLVYGLQAPDAALQVHCGDGRPAHWSTAAIAILVALLVQAILVSAATAADCLPRTRDSLADSEASESESNSYSECQAATRGASGRRKTAPSKCLQVLRSMSAQHALRSLFAQAAPARVTPTPTPAPARWHGQGRHGAAEPTGSASLSSALIGAKPAGESGEPVPASLSLSAQLAPLHGVRVLSLLLVILGHTVLSALVPGFTYPEFIAANWSSVPFQAVVSSEFAVDSFLVLSGLLGALALFPSNLNSKSSTGSNLTESRRRCHGLAPKPESLRLTTESDSEFNPTVTRSRTLSQNVPVQLLALAATPPSHRSSAAAAGGLSTPLLLSSSNSDWESEMESESRSRLKQRLDMPPTARTNSGATSGVDVNNTASTPTPPRFIPLLALAIVHRILRLLPTVAVIVAFTGWILPHVASGPFWHTVDAGAAACRSWGWTNLLFVNNIVPWTNGFARQCAAWTWYLAVDTQLHVLLLPLLAGAYRVHRRLGWAALAVAMVGCLTAGAVAVFRHNLVGLLGTYRFPARAHQAAALPIAAAAVARLPAMARASGRGASDGLQAASGSGASDGLQAGSGDAPGDYEDDFYRNAWSRAPAFLCGVAAGVVLLEWMQRPAAATRSVKSKQTPCYAPQAGMTDLQPQDVTVTLIPELAADGIGSNSLLLPDSDADSSDLVQRRLPGRCCGSLRRLCARPPHNSAALNGPDHHDGLPEAQASRRAAAAAACFAYGPSVSGALCVCILGVLFFLPARAYARADAGRPWSQLSVHCWTAFSRALWSAALAGLVVCMAAGACRPITRLLSAPLWRPLARLSFGAYMVSRRHDGDDFLVRRGYPPAASVGSVDVPHVTRYRFPHSDDRALPRCRGVVIAPAGAPAGHHHPVLQPRHAVSLLAAGGGCPLCQQHCAFVCSGAGFVCVHRVAVPAGGDDGAEAAAESRG